MEAQKAFLKGDYQEASLQYQLLAKQSFFTPSEVTLNFAHSLFEQKDTLAARKKYAQLVSLKEPNLASTTYSQLGIIFCNEKDTVRALALFKEALILKPDNEIARYNYELLKKQYHAKKNQQEADAGLRGRLRRRGDAHRPGAVGPDRFHVAPSLPEEPQHAPGIARPGRGPGDQRERRHRRRRDPVRRQRPAGGAGGAPGRGVDPGVADRHRRVVHRRPEARRVGVAHRGDRRHRPRARSGRRGTGFGQQHRWHGLEVGGGQTADLVGGANGHRLGPSGAGPGRFADRDPGGRHGVPGPRSAARCPEALGGLRPPVERHDHRRRRGPTGPRGTQRLAAAGRDRRGHGDVRRRLGGRGRRSGR